jgi:hypothetical protein
MIGSDVADQSRRGEACGLLLGATTDLVVIDCRMNSRVKVSLEPMAVTSSVPSDRFSRGPLESLLICLHSDTTFSGVDSMRARIGKKESATRLMIRVPEPLHKYLAEAADESNRSLNYEIVTRLKASIELDRLLKIEDEDQALSMLAKMKRRLIDLRLPGDDV